MITCALDQMITNTWSDDHKCISPDEHICTWSDGCMHTWSDDHMCISSDGYMCTWSDAHMFT